MNHEPDANLTFMDKSYGTRSKKQKWPVTSRAGGGTKTLNSSKSRASIRRSDKAGSRHISVSDRKSKNTGSNITKAGQSGLSESISSNRSRSTSMSDINAEANIDTHIPRKDV